MPRQARIDAPGAIHHIMARGIQRCKVFRNETDLDDFVSRLDRILVDTRTPCYAWALMPNHFHLLLRTGAVSISTAMRRLLSGYAQAFNRRHRRHGHLFQNRYKSILCQEDAYLLELVRYIHLNPLRAGVVENIKGLERYPYCGHGALLGNHPNAFQSTTLVLKHFAGASEPARKAYREFVKKGIVLGRRSDLSGGGLVRSAGGWSAVKQLRKAKLFQKADERILGDGDFVQGALKMADEQLSSKYHLKSKGWDFEKVAYRVAELLDMPAEEVTSTSKRPACVKARAILCYWANQELGLSQDDIAERIGVSQPAVCAAVQKGRRSVKEGGFELDEKEKL